MVHLWLLHYSFNTPVVAKLHCSFNGTPVVAKLHRWLLSNSIFNGTPVVAKLHYSFNGAPGTPVVAPVVAKATI